MPGMGLTPLDVVKLLPRTNCGECGEVSCLAFAVAVLSGKRSPRDCPYLDPALLAVPGEKPPDSEIEQTRRILREIRQEVAGLDFSRLAPGLGIEERGGRLYLPYLDGTVELTPEDARRLDGQELDPRDKILLYNYVHFQGKAPLSGTFVGLEAFPHSVSKVATLRRYAEEKMARALEQDEAGLRRALSVFRVKELPGEADLAFEVWVLPRVPLRIYYWRGSPEEGLSPQVKVLYDLRATEYLDLESLVFCAERFTERWIEVCACSSG
ncbi:MAG TPA: DUF3786 domain-containing protein [Thermosulfurimonas dismutans]|uniref:DUF3786 domain-containing protein n=1 Tax=Thermosulfurimonas dismutans TaxID=999894 RepID=A0A7C3GKR1_9BACT|nr:DUF3786 domain-containing protein [Thermosulfurimonas dismutans]